MNDAEKIAALAAELTRLNRLPRPWMGCFDPDALADDDDRIMALAALSGVAAEVAADERITIEKTSSGYRLSHHLMGCLGYLPTIHEALVAAIKQIEEVKNG